MKSTNKKQKHNTNELDFSPTPLQELIQMTYQCNFDSQKVKEAFIKLFGTEKIKISGNMILDEFVDEWCYAYRSVEEWRGRQDQLACMLEDLPNLYTKGQRNVWFSEVDEKD